MEEIAAAAIGALVGALAVYRLDVKKLQQERHLDAEALRVQRAEQRSAIATALIVDCRSVEHIARDLFLNENAAAWRGESPAVLFDALKPELLQLSPAALVRTMALFGAVTDLYEVLRHVRDVELTKLTPRDHWLVRLKAGFVAIEIGPTVDALIADGGKLGESKPLRIFNRPDLPHLPPPRLLSGTREMGPLSA